MSSTRGRARPLAGALCVALGALGIFTGTATAAPSTVSGGALDWGLKESFRTYIAGPIAHGTITVTEGATRNSDGTFHFPSAQGTVDADANTAELSFAGKVEFSGHDSGSGPLLHMTVEDIRVTLTGSGGKVVADVVSKALDTGTDTTYDDVELAALSTTDLTGTDTVSGTGIGATLTEAGVPAFANFYAAGTALDPVSFAVTKQTWAPAITVSKTSGLDPAGEPVTVTGSGFDPAANVGTRPPLAGQPTGVYLVFAKYADPWRPSQGAPSSARTVIDQKWVLPAASRAVLDPSGTNDDYVVLGADGTFTATLDVAAAQCADGTCGVLTYAAGGAVNAAHELATPVAFASAPTDPTEPTDPPETTDPTTPPPATGTVTSARLDWGVKESFRTYVGGPIAKGAWTLDGVTGDGPFHWANLTKGTYSSEGPDGLLDFAGSIRFTGHDQGAGPLLDLTIKQPQVSISDGKAQLLLDVRSKGLDTPGFVDLDDAEFADLDLASVTPAVQDGVVTFAGVPATLTADGAKGFAGFYEAGAQLDPVTFVVALDGATLPPPGSGGPRGQGSVVPAAQVSETQGGGLAYTGADVWLLTALGAAFLVVGTGMLTVRRKRSVS